jgi:uncharacterized membrane protein
VPQRATAGGIILNQTNSKRFSTRTLAMLGILTAIELIVCFTPLGSLPIGPIVATTSHLPVIIAAVTLGVGAGAYMGAVFGLSSFIVNTFIIPTPTSFIFTPFNAIGAVSGNFWSLFICFVPRILLGVVAALLFKWIAQHDKSRYFAYGISALAASLVHTILVLGGVYLFFGQQYAQTIGQAYSVLLGLIMTVVLTNGVPAVE